MRTDELKTIDEIALRAARIYQSHGIDVRPVTVAVHIEKCHEKACRLRLEELAKAPDFDFIHDVGGIMSHLDFAPDGKVCLTDCFLPRFAMEG